MITNRRSQEKFNSKNGENRPPLYDLSVYCGGLSWRKTNMVMKSKLLEKGQRFGHLTVMKLDHIKTKIYRGWKRNIEYYLVKCDCGNERIIEKTKLTLNRQISCGCIGKINIKKAATKHGQYKTRLNRIWAGMKTRCNNVNATEYKNYGGRGIKVCDEWQDFEHFYNWAINNGYRDDLTIDRIDVNGNYCLDNCKRSRNNEHSNNRRDTIFITYNNETHCLTEWAEILGFNYSVLFERLKRGFEIERAFTQPLQIHNRKRTRRVLTPLKKE